MKLEESSTPTSQRIRWKSANRKVSMEAVCYGPSSHEPWPMIYDQDFVAKRPGLARKLAGIMDEFAITRAYMPAAWRMSGVVAPRRSFDIVQELPNGTELCMNDDVPAEGTELGPHEAVLFPKLGGCIIFGATNGSQVIAGHAGRDSMVDRKRLLNEELRAVESVIDHVAQSLRFGGVIDPTDAILMSEPSDRFPASKNPLEIVGAFPIAPEAFPHSPRHEQHGAFNGVFRDDVAAKHPFFVADIFPDAGSGKEGPLLDIGELFSAQADYAGFTGPIVMGALPANGGFGITGHANPSMRAPRNRNLGFVVRHR